MTTHLLPALYMAHGNPMLTLEDNAYTKAWADVVTTFPKPRVVLCLSAHWVTEGTRLTSASPLQTIHDFYGFPQALFDVTYAPKGAPEFVAELAATLAPFQVRLDPAWGIDHGAWSVLRHMYPKADVPVVQMSLNEDLTFAQHYALGQALKGLRGQGVLILGSGNIVHNLRRLVWADNAPPLPWAESFHNTVKAALKAHDHEALVDVGRYGDAAKLSIPTPEHYLPLLYVAATQEAGEAVSFPTDGFDLGALSMLSVRVG